MDFDPYAEKMYPFGMLTQEQQDLIKAEGPWQVWQHLGGWKDMQNEPMWYSNKIYRRKPKPKAKEVFWRVEFPNGVFFYTQAEPCNPPSETKITKFMEE